jgi:hypothetical protein
LTAIVCRALEPQKSRFDFANIGFDLKQFRQDDCLEVLHALDSKATGQPVFLLFDEAEQIVKIAQNDPDFVSEFRGALQNFTNVKSILAASPRIYEIANLMRPSLTSPFFAGFNQRFLSILTEDEAVQLVRRPQMKVPGAKLKRILAYTHFHPCWIQLLCYSLFSNGRLLSATRDALERVYRTRKVNVFLHDAFDMLLPEEKSIVKLINQMDGLTARKLSSLIQTQKRIEELLGNLVDYGHLKREAKTYRIANWFLSYWLKIAPEAGEEIRIQLQIQINPKLCFVAMPFSKDMKDVYKLAIKPTVEECGYKCKQLDEEQINDSILEAITKGIREARFIIVDVSQARPNCYYEFGLAHGFGKRDVIPVIQKGEQIHFDVGVYKHLVYDRQDLDDLKQQLKKRIIDTVGHAPD